MNWDAIGATGEWVGGLATIGTLFYLAYQVRENTRTARSSAYQAAAAAISAWTTQVSSDAVLMNNLKDGFAQPDVLDDNVRAQVGMQFNGLFRNYENIFYQWREGAISDGVWEGCRDGSAARADGPGSCGVGRAQALALLERGVVPESPAPSAAGGGRSAPTSPSPR
jgi:hypothetical protein